MRRPSRDMMDDLTEVSAPEEIEKRNTVYVTKNIEARSRTVTFMIFGLIFGLVLSFIGYLVTGSPIAFALAVPPTVLAPFLFVGRTQDQARELRWRRAMNRLSSRDITGKVFYPNSDGPENVTSTVVEVFRSDRRK